MKIWSGRRRRSRAKLRPRFFIFFDFAVTDADHAVGMRGDEVRWLRESLERLQGVTAGQSVSDVFDTELSHLVMDFQREHRLAVDGIAGIQTQIVLASAVAAPDSPLLSAAATHGS